jgi:hypothetical protein
VNAQKVLDADVYDSNQSSVALRLIRSLMRMERQEDSAFRDRAILKRYGELSS